MRVMGVEESIRKKEEDVFCRWKKHEKFVRDGFVRDGVVCEEEYEKSNPKIAFILKEVNDEGGGGWDLREFLRKGAEKGGSTWNNVARWVYGIRHRDSMPHWKDFPSMSVKCRSKILMSICAINLKKSPGGGQTNREKLQDIAKQDSALIKEQYELYNPDITICGGTEYLFKELVMHHGQNWEETSRGVRWYERDTNKYVIDFYHPAARIESSFMLYRLIDAVNEIYGTRGLLK